MNDRNKPGESIHHSSFTTHNSLVPRLRFPEFRDAGEWHEHQLTEIANLHKGKGISKADIKETGSQPCIRYGELYTVYGDVISEVVSKTDVPPDDLFMSREGDVIIPSSGETKIDIATAACVLRENIALGGDLNVIRSEQNGVFLSYYLNGLLKHEIAKVAQGDTVVHLYKSNLEALKLAIPKVQEQQRIADCLSSLDALIAAQADKIDALKTHKKGLMQQLFPREGETVPRLRFPEFRDAGEWVSRKLSKLLKKIADPVTVEDDQIYREVGIRSHGKGIFHKDPISGKAIGNKRVFWIEENTLIVNIVFAWELAVANTTEAEKGMIASHRFPMYRPMENKADVRYMKYFFLTHKGKELLWIASPGGAGRNKTLGQKDFENLEFLIPERLTEQQKIADCLSSVDELIAAQSEKLDALKAHKKGLMQQLFPSLGVGVTKSA